MDKYRQYALMLKPIEEKDLILFDISMEEKTHIVKQYNRALVNAQGEGTDVAQIFLKPLIATYPNWGDTALVFGLCLAREKQFERAEQSIEFAINNTLGSEAVLTIAQEAIRAVREDAKNPELREMNNGPRGGRKGGFVSDGDSAIARNGMQAPILMKASNRPAKIQMASDRERRDIMMRSASVGDENTRDDINMEDVKTPGEQMRSAVKIIAIIVAIAAVFCIVYFGIIPLINNMRHAKDTEARLEYLVDRMGEHTDDPEVATILASYAEKFDGIVVETEATTTEQTTETTLPPTDTPTPTPEVALPVIGGSTEPEETAVPEETTAEDVVTEAPTGEDGNNEVAPEA